METHRLKLKVGPHEFEAEGSPEEVTRQFETWKELIASLGSGKSVQRQENQPNGSEDDQDQQVGQFDASIFQVDQTRRHVSLRVLPQGARRDADSLLMLLLGYRQAFGEEDVMVGRLKESMADSGRQLERIDRTIAPHLASGLVRKGGTGKGGRYRLSNTGIARAEELIQSLK